MSFSKKQKTKKRPVFAFGKGFFPYTVLLIFSVLFTQILKSSVSVVLLCFVAVLPFAMLITALISRAGVDVFIRSDGATCEKNVPVYYEFYILNSSFFPVSYLEAEMLLPSEKRALCSVKKAVMYILPKNRYVVSGNAVFKYRGQYSVGVGDVYVSDMLRLFVLKKTVDRYAEISVLPRKLYLERQKNAPSDMSSASPLTLNGDDQSDPERIREYRFGDSQKHIHWKLSSKMDELLVTEYKPEAAKKVYVLCDFSRYLPEEETDGKKTKRSKKKTETKNKKRKEVKLNIERKERSFSLTEETLTEARKISISRAEAASALAKARKDLSDGEDIGDAEDIENIEDKTEERTEREAESVENVGYGIGRTADERENGIDPEYREEIDLYCADGVSEIAIGAVMHELSLGNSVTLMWFDSRAEAGFYEYTLESYSDLDLIFTRFATAPFAAHEFKVTRLPQLISESQSPTLIYATSRAEMSEVGEFIEAGNSVGALSSEILFFNAAQRYEDPLMRAKYVETCRARFAENNIILTDVAI